MSKKVLLSDSELELQAVTARTKQAPSMVAKVLEQPMAELREAVAEVNAAEAALKKAARKKKAAKVVKKVKKTVRRATATTGNFIVRAFHAAKAALKRAVAWLGRKARAIGARIKEAFIAAYERLKDAVAAARRKLRAAKRALKQAWATMKEVASTFDGIAVAKVALGTAVHPIVGVAVGMMHVEAALVRAERRKEIRGLVSEMIDVADRAAA